MTTATIAQRWRCEACNTIFSGGMTVACPRCGNDDDETITPMKASNPVKSAPIAKPKAAPRKRLFPDWDRVPAWFLGTALLLLWWAFGAKYTIDGLPLLCNLLAGWFHIPIALAPVTDGRWYVRLFWLPLLISLVERQYQPWRRRDILSKKAYWLPLIWLVVIGVDFGSTYLAIKSPADDAWPLTMTIATTWPLAAGWSLLTTFGPESGLSWFWRWVRGA